MMWRFSGEDLKLNFLSKGYNVGEAFYAIKYTPVKVTKVTRSSTIKVLKTYTL
jgi:hypothetical protein